MKRIGRVSAIAFAVWVLMAGRHVCAEEPAALIPVTRVTVATPQNAGAAERGRMRIRKALAEPTTMDFVTAPLSDVAEYLKDLHGIEIQLDNHALNADDMCMPVTTNVKGISLEMGLSLLLQPRGMVYLVEDNVLVITTRKAASRAIRLRIYDCSWAGERLPAVVEAISLADRMGLPDDKDAADAAPMFKVSPYGMDVIVRANELQHDIVERLLIDLRGVESKPPGQ